MTQVSSREDLNREGNLRKKQQQSDGRTEEKSGVFVKNVSFWEG